MPTPEELHRARPLYRDHEARDVFYRLALDLLALNRAGDERYTAGEALSVLLQTWNRRFYVKKYNALFPPHHLEQLQELLQQRVDDLAVYRQRSLQSLTADDRIAAERIFRAFEILLG